MFFAWKIGNGKTSFFIYPGKKVVTRLGFFPVHRQRFQISVNQSGVGFCCMVGYKGVDRAYITVYGITAASIAVFCPDFLL